jgi:chaperonin GroEL
MAAKRIRFRAEARESVLKGAATLADAVRITLGALKSQAKPVETQAAQAQVATIAAHNDPAVGALVAEAVSKVGPEGAVTVEEAKSTDTSLEIVEGLQFDRGYLSPYFVTDPEKMQVVLDDCRVLLCDRKISNLPEALPILEQAAKAGTGLLVIAEEIEG